jgi:hypothetical protein
MQFQSKRQKNLLQMSSDLINLHFDEIYQYIVRVEYYFLMSPYTYDKSVDEKPVNVLIQLERPKDSIKTQN